MSLLVQIQIILHLIELIYKRFWFSYCSLCSYITSYINWRDLCIMSERIKVEYLKAAPELVESRVARITTSWAAQDDRIKSVYRRQSKCWLFSWIKNKKYIYRIILYETKYFSCWAQGWTNTKRWLQTDWGEDLLLNCAWAYIIYVWFNIKYLHFFSKLCLFCLEKWL